MHDPKTLKFENLGKISVIQTCGIYEVKNSTEWKFRQEFGLLSLIKYAFEKLQIEF